MTNLLIQSVGAAIIVLGLLDIFFTIVFPASGHGPVRKPVELAVWRCFRFLALLTQGQRRRNLLSYSGPVIVICSFAIWFGLLVVGWAMVFKPALGNAITASSGVTDRSWATAVYYSGFNFTTLGVGDLAAHTGLYRLLTIVEAALGFAGFSAVVITYFLSVHSALTTRNAYAQKLHFFTGQTGSAADLLARIAYAEGAEGIESHLSSFAEFLRNSHQTHRFYPVLRFFHYREEFYSLPRILLVALDIATLIRSGFDHERYERLLRCPALDDLFQAALSFTREMSDPIPQMDSDASIAESLRAHYQAAVCKLSAAGISIPADTDRGATQYMRIRGEWDLPVRTLSNFMMYDWTLIEPAISRSHLA